MNEKLSKALVEFARDHLWVSENLETLLKQYADQWVAVMNGHVIASNPDLGGLVSELADPAHTCVEFVTREPLEMVL